MKLSDEALQYADKLFPCEPPCDTYGICEGCSERTIFHAGYNFGVKEKHRLEKEINFHLNSANEGDER